MICDCQFTKRDNKGQVEERGCHAEAVKTCKHGFNTCAKHFHGCKGESNGK